MAEDETDLDLRGIAGLIRRQIRLIATTIVLVLGLAALWVFSLTPLYTASALILIDPASSNLLDSATRTTPPATDNARVASEVEILRSEATSLAVGMAVCGKFSCASLDLSEKLITLSLFIVSFTFNCSQM